MPHLGHHFAVRNSVAAQSVGDEAPRLELEAGQQPFEEAFGGCGVAAALHQDVEHDAALVHRAPEVMPLAVDAQEDLIEVPSVARFRSPLTELAGKVGAEPEAPLPDALVRNADPTLGQDQLDLTQAQAEDMVEPDGVADDRSREAVAGVPGQLGNHAISLND